MSLGTPRLAARGSSGRLARPLKRFSTATPLAQHRTGAMNWTVKPITRRTLLFGLTPLAAGAMVIGGMGSSSLEAKAATPSTSAPQAQNGRQGAAALAHGDGGSDSGGAVATQRQYMIVMRHGQRIDEVDKTWSLDAERPFDPYLTPKGEEQARDAGQKLKGYGIEKLFVSPFLRCLQTAKLCNDNGVHVPPEDWTVTCAVGEFLNPFFMVKNGAKVPPGNVNDWFFMTGNLKDDLPKKLLPPDFARRVQLGETSFKKYPENLLNSRKRYVRAYQEIADAADGANVLVVTHLDGVNASVARMMPWAIVYPVQHTGFTIAYRERPVGEAAWGKWELESKSGENGVWWNGRLQPAYWVYKGVQGVVGRVWGIWHKGAEPPSMVPMQDLPLPSTEDLENEGEDA